MDRERNQRHDGRPDGDQHPTQANNSRIQQRLAHGFAAFMRLRDKIEQHDDMADYHAHQREDAEEGHEARRRIRDVQSRECATHPVGDRREHQQWLDCVSKLSSVPRPALLRGAFVLIDRQADLVKI